MDQDADENADLQSKQAQAMAALGPDPNLPYKRKRVRRRRRSLRRRILDSILPFAIVVALAMFAAGLVKIVEVGAAKNSKPRSSVRVEPKQMSPRQQFDFELAQREYQNLMRKHSNQRRAAAKPQNQVAYQLSLESEAARETAGLGTRPPSPKSADDVMDWSLFEQGEDPRSALKRGTDR
ncbi:MAG: hypothetical protein GY733_21205 [bacterium]|nr:hypothetical protein [bacterium]